MTRVQSIKNQALPVERFVELFVAALVDDGWRRVALNDSRARSGLAAVVAIMDNIIKELADGNESWDILWPWLQTANRLRLSSVGGLENWEHQLRAAQQRFTRVPNPDYETIDFTIDPLVAKSEIESISPGEQRLLRSAVEAFNASFDATQIADPRRKLA